MGRPIQGSSVEDQLTFRDYELQHKLAAAGRKINAAPTAESKADAITRFYEVPKEKVRDAADRANIASTIAGGVGTMRHEVHVVVSDHRTSATVKSKHDHGVHYAMGKSGG